MSVRAVLREILPSSVYSAWRYIYRKSGGGTRGRKIFRDTYSFLERSQWWTKSELEDYQMLQLSKLLNHAYAHVPYYRRVFDEHGIKPTAIQTLDDLRVIPFLTKQIIQENMGSLIADNFERRNLEYVTTGGSTGIPMGFYVERNVTDAKEEAFMFSQWKRVGFVQGDSSAVLRGNIVKGADVGKFWEHDRIAGNLILSSYHMTDQFLGEYVRKIRDFGPAFIQAYPSAASILASYMIENRVEPFPSVKAILCGSENIYAWQREKLEKAFQCRVYSWYGHAEKAALAGECEKSNYYHAFPEYGVFEVIGANGETLADDGDSGEVVATGFNNYAMPLIRYRTMDRVTRANGGCECGRNYQLIKNVDGRLQELIMTAKGRMISMTAINMHSDIFDNVRQFQFVQEEKGVVILNLVTKNGYSDKDDAIIREELMKKLGDDVNLRMEYRDEIPRTQTGKFRFLIQKLSLPYGD